MQILKKAFNISYYTYFQIFNIVIFLYTSSCIYGLNLNTNCSNDIVTMWNKHKQLISTIQHYQIQGNIIFIIDSQKKTYIKFLWTKYDNNCHNIRLFNIFGVTMISICIKHGIVYIMPNVICQNNDFIKKIEKWLTQTDFFEKQLQKWIIGLPGDNTKYHINNYGFLSDISYDFYDKTVFVLYSRYFTNKKPELPKILEAYYSTFFIKLNIDQWNL